MMGAPNQSQGTPEIFDWSSSLLVSVYLGRGRRLFRRRGAAVRSVRVKISKNKNYFCGLGMVGNFIERGCRLILIANGNFGWLNHLKFPLIFMGLHKHGLSKTYHFYLWLRIKRSGKKICEQWADENYGFKKFILDIGPRPSGNHFFRLTKRKDGYYPNNYRWMELKSATANTLFNIPSGCHFAGVYKISFDDKYFYIGSSKSVHHRIMNWKHRLSIKEPKNINILEIIDKVKCVSFSILERVDNFLELRQKETDWITENWENKLLLNRCPSGYNNKNIRPYNSYVKPEKIKGEITPPKPVGQFDQNGTLLFKFYSISAAERATGCRDITSQLQGKRGLYNGYIFKEIYPDGSYKEPPLFVRQTPIFKKKRIFVPSKNRKPIIQYDLRNNLVANFDSCHNAALLTGISRSNIRKVLQGKRVSAKGFIFSYA